MKRNFLLTTTMAITLALGACGDSSKPATQTPAPAATSSNVVMGSGDTCRFAWSHYTGWEPVYMMQSEGIAERMGAKYNVNITISPPMDYVESLTQFAAGTFDFVTSTGMDALTIPAAGGTVTDYIVAGDFSNGNDAIVVIDPAGSIQSVADLKGKEVILVEGSVSDFMLSKALDDYGLSGSDVVRKNTSDADIGSILATASDGTVAVTWNPIVLQTLEARKNDGARSVFDSSQTPGLIMDGILANDGATEACRYAVTAAWYEAVSLIPQSRSANADPAAYERMARFASGNAANSVELFDAQLGTTRMFYTPMDGISVMESQQLKDNMEFIREFAAGSGLIDSADVVGVSFPDGSVQGGSNVKLRFTSKYMNGVR